MSLLTHELARAIPIRSLGLLAQLWNPDQEQSVPTWFSSFLLGFAAFLLWLTSQNSALAKNRASDWRGLAIVFTALCIEEIAGFHERTIMPLRELFQASGPFVFAWVIPGFVFVVIVALRFWPFLRSLEPSLRRVILLAGAIYVGGALFMEMLGGYLGPLVGKQGYFLLLNVEEFLEMSGSTLLITAILRYWQTQPATSRHAVEQELVAEDSIPTR